MIASNNCQRANPLHGHRAPVVALQCLFAALATFGAPLSVRADGASATNDHQTNGSAASDFDPFESTVPPAATDECDPFEAHPSARDPFERTVHVATTVDTPRPHPIHSPIHLATELSFRQLPTRDEPANDEPATRPTDESDEANEKPTRATNDPCAGVMGTPMCELGIDIVLPAGLLPKDHAGLCWAEGNATAGPYPAMRCWPVQPFMWEAPNLCYRPLYFEDTNLERYGYGCHPCLQPAISAAHFFVTVPALPYCMVEHCPNKCEYTLGHYRPGSCGPWRMHGPTWRPLAAAAQAGVVTGLIFAIP